MENPYNGCFKKYFFTIKLKHYLRNLGILTGKNIVINAKIKKIDKSCNFVTSLH